MRTPPTKSYIALARPHAQLADSQLHGVAHWLSVEYFGQRLSELTPGADPEVVAAFAAFHDAARVEEESDPGHGRRGAELASQLHRTGQLPLRADQLAILVNACEYHSDGRVTTDPTTAVCWDADRLDLARRFNAQHVDASLLSTQAAYDNALDLIFEVSCQHHRARATLLADQWRAGGLQEDLPTAVAGLWMSVTYPRFLLPDDSWLELFAAAGYISNDRRPRPTKPVTLFRADSLASGGRGFHWTPDIYFAQVRARMPLAPKVVTDRASGEAAAVFTATVPPEAILARFDYSTEIETVVNPRLLTGPTTPTIVQTFDRVHDHYAA